MRRESMRASARRTGINIAYRGKSEDERSAANNGNGQNEREQTLGNGKVE